MEEKFNLGRKKAMAILLHNDRTEWELRDKLQQHGFEEEVIEDAIAYVESFHYIDDRRYAMRFAEIYKDSRSIQRIRQDLQKRHVDDLLIEEALENIIGDDSRALRKEIRKLTKGQQNFFDRISYQEKTKIYRHVIPERISNRFHISGTGILSQWKYIKIPTICCIFRGDSVDYFLDIFVYKV